MHQAILLAAQTVNEIAPAVGGGHHVDWPLVASLFTNVILFFGFLGFKVKPLVSQGLKDRRENMAVELRKADEQRKEAEARLAEYKAKLDNLEDEVARIVAEYETQAEAEKAVIEEETTKALARLEKESEVTISQEMRKAENLIRDAAVKATLEAAEQIITSRITDADQRRLADQYVASLEQGAN